MATDIEPILELQGVNKSFGVVHVLHDVDFRVYPGQVTALVGDNGAGEIDPGQGNCRNPPHRHRYLPVRGKACHRP